VRLKPHTRTKCALRFPPSATLPTGGVITESHYMQMSSQGVMSGEQTNNSPDLCPIKGQ